MKIKYIFFDCFGVIAAEVAPVWTNAHLTKEQAKEFLSGVMVESDYGRVKQDEMFSILSNLCGEPKEQVREEWIRLAKVNEEVRAYIKELRKTYKTALLSNAYDGCIGLTFSDEELDELFDVKVISSEVGQVKPLPDIYKTVLKRASCEPCEAVFTDDNPVNLQTAEELGINVIHFKNLEQFKKELNEIVMR